MCVWVYIWPMYTTVVYKVENCYTYSWHLILPGKSNKFRVYDTKLNLCWIYMSTTHTTPLELQSSLLMRVHISCTQIKDDCYTLKLQWKRECYRAIDNAEYDINPCIMMEYFQINSSNLRIIKKNYLWISYRSLSFWLSLSIFKVTGYMENIGKFTREDAMMCIRF